VVRVYPEFTKGGVVRVHKDAHTKGVAKEVWQK